MNLDILVTIQDILLQVSTETIETVIYQIQNSSFNTFKKFIILIKIIFEIVYKKRNLRIYLSALCREFSNFHKNKKKLNEFKHLFLSKFLEIETFSMDIVHSHIHFYFLCISTKFLTTDEVIDQMQLTVTTEKIANKPYIVYYILLYFSPIIKTKNNEFYKFLCDQFDHNIKIVTDYSKSLLRHWGHLPERLLWINDCIIQNKSKIMDKEEWIEREAILKNGFSENSIESIIVNDDVDQLQEFISKSGIDIDDFKCKDSFLLYQEIFDKNDIFLLNFAAALNSIQCFKYLLLNKVKPDNFYSNLMIYSVKGGNPEIVRILYQRKFSLDGCLVTSFLFFHFDIFQWIYQMRNENDDEILLETIKNDCLLSFSLHSLKFLCEVDSQDKNSSKKDQLLDIINKKLLDYS